MRRTSLLVDEVHIAAEVEHFDSHLCGRPELHPAEHPGPNSRIERLLFMCMTAETSPPHVAA